MLAAPLDWHSPLGNPGFAAACDATKLAQVLRLHFDLIESTFTSTSGIEKSNSLFERVEFIQ